MIQLVKTPGRPPPSLSGPGARRESAFPRFPKENFRSMCRHSPPDGRATGGGAGEPAAEGVRKKLPEEASHFVAAVDEARKAARGVAPPGSRPHFRPSDRPVSQD